MAVRRGRSLVLAVAILIAVLLPAIATVSRRPGVDPKDGDPHGSLKGVLRALERRRRAPQGPYSLASYQDRNPQDVLEYLASIEGYQPDLDRDHVMNYLEKDDDYPAEDSFKGTAFRERHDQLKLANAKKVSAFRERENKNHVQPEQLEELFMRNFEEKAAEDKERSDEEYADLLRRLWDKYKYTHPTGGIEELRERNIRKRQLPGAYNPAGGWGPLAFKRKRSSNQRLDNTDSADFLYSLKFVPQSDPSVVENLKDDKIVDEEEDPDISAIFNNQEFKYGEFEMPPRSLDEEPKLGLQSLNYQSPDEMYLPDNSETIGSPVPSEDLYPISKRSNAPLDGSKINKQFRSTFNDPKVMKDLSSIFGEKSDSVIQKPVKRSSGSARSNEDNSHEAKSPTISAMSHNSSKESFSGESHKPDDKPKTEHPHSRHEHENRPPMMTTNARELDHSHEGADKKIPFDDEEETHIPVEHPIILKKKSIDWSNYFGIDKRKKKSVGPAMPMVPFMEKRFMNDPKMSMSHETNSSGDKQRKGKPETTQTKLENMENKIKNMESVIVDDALEDDSAEDQELKEKLLARLAAAYSLEKMRKALKELKYTLQSQKEAAKEKPSEGDGDDMEKRSSVSKATPTTAPVNEVKHVLDPEDIKALLDDNYFQNEQGAGHFLNGPSDGDTNGLSNKPSDTNHEDGSCPILDRIVRRCHNVDILAGNHGQLFMPLCSLHQVCYLCGPSSRTGCDLIFLSEADSACGGHPRCQRAARGALMALRELHEPLAHHLQGECSRDTCLARPLQESEPWRQSFRR